MTSQKIIVKNGKQLRFGYTTGSCATAATTAATKMLLTQAVVQSVIIVLPNGQKVAFQIDDIQISKDKVSCSVIKDAGDDPDVTDGIKIFAESAFCAEGIVLHGGIGVGIVTSKGLRCAIGQPAINPMPRKMIMQNGQNICREHNYAGGIHLTVSVPEGQAIAQKTFNPRIGIVGGISILGTTGIVEPMSEQALLDTVKLFIDRQKVVNEDNILISPGNYGRDFCQNVLHLNIDNAIKFSNFIGETLDYLVYKQFKKVLLVGHIGKLVKIAGGIMNTHSSNADCRMEIFASHTAFLGGRQQLVQKIMNSHTTDEVIAYLQEEKLCEAVFASIIKKILYHINYRTKNKLAVEVILFGAENKAVFKSDNAEGFLQLFIEVKE